MGIFDVWNTRFNMTNQTLEILVIDDKKENRKAASDFFSTQGDLKIDYAFDYQSGLKKLHEKTYDGAVIDVQMPYKTGEEAHEYGILIGRAAEDLAVPFVFLTSKNYEHNGTQRGSAIYSDEFCLTNDKGKITAEKTTPKAWADAYSELKSVLGTPEMTRKAKERYIQVNGRFYRQSLVKNKSQN